MSNSEIIININKVIAQLLPDVVNIGLEAIGQKLENETKTAAYMPVDDGQLRASITHEVDEKKGVVYIGSNLEYAPYVHEGTGLFANNDDGRQTPWKYKDAKGNWHTTNGQEPQPFLQRTVDENIESLPNVFINLLDREAKKRGL